MDSKWTGVLQLSAKPGTEIDIQSLQSKVEAYRPGLGVTLTPGPEIGGSATIIVGTSLDQAKQENIQEIFDFVRDIPWDTMASGATVADFVYRGYQKVTRKLDEPYWEDINHYLGPARQDESKTDSNPEVIEVISGSGSFEGFARVLWPEIARRMDAAGVKMENTDQVLNTINLLLSEERRRSEEED